MNIVFYHQDGCGSCIATKRKLEKLELDYEPVDVTHDEDAREELRQLGVKQMPAVVVGDTIITGYRPDELAKLVD